MLNMLITKYDPTKELWSENS